MKFERVGSITVRRILFQILWKINNLDGFEGTLFDTDTATYRKNETVSVIDRPPIESWPG
jgi:hypothetical protein